MAYGTMWIIVRKVWVWAPHIFVYSRPSAVGRNYFDWQSYSCLCVWYDGENDKAI